MNLEDEKNEPCPKCGSKEEILEVENEDVRTIVCVKCGTHKGTIELSQQPEGRLSNERCSKCGSFSEAVYNKGEAKEIYCAYCGEFKAIELKK